MKEANNNEVDLLLRALAAQRRTVPLGAAEVDAQPVPSDHLDADELNSYAEGMAPEAARARFNQHLADCDSCRGLVVSLTQASGAAARLELPAQPRGLTFWQRLGALFAQPVWRYAVPAIILTTVIGIGLLALRQQRRTDFVAQNETQDSRQLADKPAGAPAPTTYQQPKPENGVHSATPPAESDKERGLLQTEKSRSTTQDEEAPVNVPKAAPAKDSAAAGGITATTTESRPTDALESKVAAAEPPPAPVGGYAKSAELAKEQPSKREDQDRNRDEGFRVQQQDDVHGPNRGRSNTAPMSNQQNADSAVRRGGPSGMDKNKKQSEPETRSVMGRRFTRDGGAWVDTAYESSRATTRVVRGSDQYRALVADEPAIRTIAEQLDGVVVVVWKGRAYRIQ